MIDSKVLNYCKDFLNDLNSNESNLKMKGFNLREDKEHNKKEVDELTDNLNSLFAHTIKLLLSIQESNKNHDVLVQIGESVEFDFLSSRLSLIFYDYIKEKNLSNKAYDPKTSALKLKCKTFEEELLEAYDIFFFIKMINDSTQIYKQDIQRMSRKDKYAYDFFQQNSATIEIIFENQIQRVYFMKHPISNFLDIHHKNSLMNSVRRDNPNEKISDFFAATPRLFDMMDHTYNLSHNLKLKPGYLDLIRDIALILSIIINLFIFWNFKIEVTKQIGRNDESMQQDVVFRICGVLHLISSSIMIILQIFIKTRMILMDNWREEFSAFKKQFIGVARSNSLEDQRIMAILNKNISSVTVADTLKVLKK